MSNKKALLKKLGEETLYSAKGHFKACDLRRNLVTITLWLCAVANVVSFIGTEPTIDKWLAGIGIFGTFALLMWNEGEGKDYKGKHKQSAESYLALHKEIRSCFFLEDCSAERAQQLSREVNEIDQMSRPDIPWIAKRWAQRAIANGETDNWFKNEY